MGGDGNNAQLHPGLYRGWVTQKDHDNETTPTPTSAEVDDDAPPPSRAGGLRAADEKRSGG
jgi:hypothetical protein